MVVQSLQRSTAVDVAVVVLPLLGLAVTRASMAPLVASGDSFAVAAAVAAVGYERSRSAWVPALAFGTYLILVSPELAFPLAGPLR
jgi:hypothetical protein